MVEMINLIFVYHYLRDVAKVSDQFWGENWHIPPLFIALSFHNGLEDRVTNGQRDMTFSALHQSEIL